MNYLVHNVRHAPPALLPLPSESEPTRDTRTDATDKKPQKNSISFPPVAPRSTDKARIDSANTENLARPLYFPSVDTHVVLIAKSIYRIGVAYGKYGKGMHIAALFLDI